MGDARLWTDGRIFTGQRYVESLFVEDGHVVAAGPASEVRRSAPTGTEVIPLAGRVVLPGLIDAHLHLSDLARFRDGLVLEGVLGFDDLAHRIREWASSHPTGSIVGRGLDVDRALDGRWPRRSDLDRLAEDRPVVLLHTSGHAAMLNSAALAGVGLRDHVGDDLGDRISRDSEGRADGILYDEALRRLELLTRTPVASAQLVNTLEFLATFGVTTAVSMNASEEEARSVRALAEEGRSPIRVRSYLRVGAVDSLRDEDRVAPRRPDRFRVVGIKGFTDGAFGPRTAWLSEPYRDAPETSGLAVDSDETLAAACAAAVARGLAPALHAIGDRAVMRAAQLLSPYSRPPGAPPRIEHVSLTPPAVLSVLDQVRPALVVQPGFVWSDAWLPERLGSERARWAYAFRTFRNRGYLVAGSTDAPYDPVDPWRGLRAAVERRDPLGGSANPDPSEALAPEEAAQLFGVNAGQVLGEPTLGLLEPGASADLVVTEARTLAEACLRGSSSVRETWVNGTRVYERRTVDSPERG